MLTRWLTFTAFLVGSASHGGAAVTPAPTCRVKGHPEAELTLHCGDGRRAGVVQVWHTPFGDLQSPGPHSELDPVFMHHDGSLVIPNTSSLHSGLYYCLLQHTEGTTLWPYELHVGPSDLDHREHSSCAVFRVRRDVGSKEDRQAGVSDGQFAGAVAASVVLTFVVGFSVGALARSHVLRCLAAVTTRLKSPWRRQNHHDEPDLVSDVVMTTLPPMCDSQTFEIEQVTHDDGDSAICATMETTMSSTTPSPPAKPQRSFRHKRVEQQEAMAYLEGCDTVEKEEEEGGGRVEEKNEGCGEEEREFSGFYLPEDGESKTETDEEKCSEDTEKMEEEEKTEEVERMDEEVREEAANQKGEENREESTCREPEQLTDSADGDRNHQNQEASPKTSITEDPPPSAPCTTRRSRVIRLYQYDEDGQRYCHLPDPAPDEPGPAPHLKQRSLSLTRLSTIMAAAAGSPLESRETGKEETHFNMEI